MEQKKNNVLLTLMLALLMAVTIVFISWYNQKEDTLFCHFENNITDSEIPRYECLNIKMTSNELDKVDVSQFDELSMRHSCSKDYEELPGCYGYNYYLSSYKLSTFSKQKIDGKLCVAYWVTYYKDTNLIAYYQERFMQNIFNNTEELEKRFLGC